MQIESIVAQIKNDLSSSVITLLGITVFVTVLITCFITRSPGFAFLDFMLMFFIYRSWIRMAAYPLRNKLFRISPSDTVNESKM